MSSYPQVGSQFGAYRIESLLGRGGMSVVYLAQHLRLERKVALKLLSPDLADDPGFRDRFIRESRMAAALDHPNVIPIYEAGEENGVLFIAMRYVRGTDLKALLRSEGRLDLHRTASILAQVADALDAAHDEGLIHRDIKPANVLIGARSQRDPGDHLYLSDFGLTKRTVGSTDLTSSGQLLGTIDYIAPEQIRGGAVDRRADIYSLGCLTYECLTGQVPYQHQTEAAVLYAHLQSDPPKVTGQRPDLPADLDAVVAKAMAKNPEERQPTAGDFAREVRTVAGISPNEPILLATEPDLHGATTREGADGRVRKRRSRLSVLLLVGAALSLGAVFLVVRVLTAAPGGRGGADTKGAPSSVPASPPAARVIGVYRIDSGTAQVGSSASTPYPYSVAAGEGAVWVATNERILKINAQSVRQIGTIDVPGVLAFDIAAGGGAVWTIGTGGERSLTVGPTPILTRIDPATNRRAARIKCPRLQANTPGNATVAIGEGAVWVALSPPSKLLKVDPSRNRIVGVTHLPTAADEVVAGGGSVWVRSSLDGVVYRIDPKSLRTLRTIELSGADAMAYGADALWVADRSSGTITRIDPATGKPSAITSVGGSPSAIAADGSGVWVISVSNETVNHIDALSNKVVDRIPLLGGHDVAVGEGFVWVASCGSITCT